MIIDPESLIMSLDNAVRWRQKLKSASQRLALTNGCFDLLHRGHAQYLMQARVCADALLILLNDDESVRALKGDGRPLNDAFSRAYVLGSLRHIDAVVIFSGKRCTRELEALKPDVYVKGGDYSLGALDASEREILQACKAEFRFIPFVGGFSTTDLISRLDTPMK